MKEDEELVEAALAGSAEAFGELVERHQQRLFRFLLTRCATRADAEDALQDTFLNAFHYLPTYRPRWRFSTWLYRIAIGNAARRRTRPIETLADPAADGTSLLEQCIVDSDLDNLWLAAGRLLSPEVRTALWLRYAEDMTVKEVAHALGRSQAWTKVTLLRARRRLSAELGNRAPNASEGKVYG